MHSDRSTKILASLFAMVFALFITSLILAGEKAETTGAQKAGKAVEQPAGQAADPLEVQPVAAGQEAPVSPDEPPDGEIDTPPEPQAVVKTKTKSNQSND